MFTLNFDALMVLKVLISLFMMKIFLSRYPPQCQAGRVVLSNVIAESFEKSFSLDDFEASAIENSAAVPNLDVVTVFGREGVIIAHAEVQTTSVRARAMNEILGNA